VRRRVGRLREEPERRESRPTGSEEEDEDVFVVEVPDGEEFDAKFAARVCPVDAIEVYDDDGEQVV